MSAVLPIARDGHLRRNTLINIESVARLQISSSPLLKERNSPKRCFLVVVFVVVVAGLLREEEIPKAKAGPSTAKQDKNCSTFLLTRYRNIVGTHLCNQQNTELHKNFCS